jgi:hypothetical protein
MRTGAPGAGAVAPPRTPPRTPACLSTSRSGQTRSTWLHGTDAGCRWSPPNGAVPAAVRRPGHGFGAADAARCRLRARRGLAGSGPSQAPALGRAEFVERWPLHPNPRHDATTDVVGGSYCGGAPKRAAGSAQNANQRSAPAGLVRQAEPQPQASRTASCLPAWTLWRGSAEPPAAAVADPAGSGQNCPSPAAAAAHP